MAETTIRLLSDLHLEFYGTPERTGIKDDVACDVVVLAGDIDNGEAGIDWAGRTFDRPVIYVMGNHEYYGYDINELLPLARECAADTGVHLLDRNTVNINGLRFAGCTLWSGLDHRTIDQITIARTIQERLVDFDYITIDDRPMHPERMVSLHEMEREWLAGELQSTEPTVVVTHFVPSAHHGLLHPKYPDDAMTAYFHNRLDDWFNPIIPAWCYGHNHAGADRVLHNTRLVANQLGYPHEKTDFASDFTFTIRS